MSLPKPYYEHTIYHGNCREILPSLSQVDLVLTDPPYGIGVDRAMHASGGTQYGVAAAEKRHYAATGWDDSAPDDGLLAMVIHAGKQACVWGGNYFALPRASCVLVWDKENDHGDRAFAHCELRRAIGIELEERYCEIAAKRLAQEVLFPAEGSR